jgi:hypothetical protein
LSVIVVGIDKDAPDCAGDLGAAAVGRGGTQLDPQYDRGTSVARVIVVAECETGRLDAFDGDRRTFHLKERVTSSDARDPHVAAQLIERIG